jgi:ABC-type sugar transport system substrate-binding protein
MSRFTSKNAMAIATILSVSALVAGCGGGADSDKGSSSGGGGDPEAAAAASDRLDPLLEPVTDITITEPLNKTPEPGKTAALVFASNPTTADIPPEFTKAVEALGWDAKIITIDASDPLGPVNGIKQAVQDGADYILNILGDIPSIQPGLDVAKEAGVPVVIYSGTGEADPEENGVYGMVNTAEGAVAPLNPVMDWVISDSGGAANIVYVTLPEAEIVKVSTDLAAKHFTDSCPKCNVDTNLGISFAQLGAGGLADLVVPEVRKNPDAKYVVIGVSPAANGLREALDAAGLTDVKIALGNMTSDQIPLLREGAVGIGTINALGEVTWESVDMMARIDTDTPFDPQDYAESPIATFTQDNLPDDLDKYLGAENYEEQYLELWGKG